MLLWTTGAEKLPEPLHLFPAMKCNQLWRNRPLHALEQGPEVAGRDREASHRQRRRLHLMDRAKHFPRGMVPDRVILHSQLELRHEDAALSRTHFAVVLAEFLGKCSRLPALH